MKPSSFKDYFSDQAGAYKTFRPTYPKVLFDYLASISPSRELAWDCACGSGQASEALVNYFLIVVATDGSQDQICNANPYPNIQYRMETAEHSSLPTHSVDLIVVGQALHWFVTDAFFAEAKRVLKPKGVLAVWSYNLLTISPGLDEIIREFDKKIIGEYWAPERVLVDHDYRDIQFPFQTVITKNLTMRENWNFQQLVGYLDTWSAVQAYRKSKQAEPLDLINDNLLLAWGSPSQVRAVSWPLKLYVCINNSNS